MLLDVKIECIVGIFPEEKINPQPIILQLSSEDCAIIESDLKTLLTEAWNLPAKINLLFQHGNYDLIEHAINDVASMIIWEFSYIDKNILTKLDEFCLKIIKPFALGGHGIPNISVSLEDFIDKPVSNYKRKKIDFIKRGDLQFSWVYLKAGEEISISSIAKVSKIDFCPKIETRYNYDNKGAYKKIFRNLDKSDCSFLIVEAVL